MQIKDYVTELSSAASTPGGGSASALTGILGISLLEMAVRLTKDKKAYAQEQQLYEEVLKAWQEQKAQLEKTMAEDAKAFEAVMQLYRKKPTEEEKTSHHQALQEAFLYAGQVPLMGAKRLVEALQYTVKVQEKINPWMISDVIGGIELISGALRSILLNVAINIHSMEEGSVRQQLEQEMQECKAQGNSLYRSLQDVLYQNATFQSLR